MGQVWELYDNFCYKQVAVLVRQVGFGHTVLCSWNFEILCPDFDAFLNRSSTIQKIASLMVQAIDCRGVSQLQNTGLGSIAAWDWAYDSVDSCEAWSNLCQYCAMLLKFPQKIGSGMLRYGAVLDSTVSDLTLLCCIQLFVHRCFMNVSYTV